MLPTYINSLAITKTRDNRSNMKLAQLSTLLLLFCGFQALTACGQDPPAYRDALLSLHQSLVEFPSITDNETAVGDFLIDYLMEQGLTTERQFLNGTEGRFNVLAWPEPRPSNWSRVVVTSHIDVVPPYTPYSRSGPEPPTAETLLSGRGVVDAKGSVATQTIALLELLAERAVDGDDVMLVFVAGEERTGDGMKHFSNVTATLPNRPLVAIFGEPTDGILACGHKGALVCDVHAAGKSGHSGYPETGKSATQVLMRGLVQALDTDLGSSDLYGNTTINVGILEGGTAGNVIADAAMAAIVVRVAIGPEREGHEIVRRRLEEVLTNTDDEAFTTECGLGFGAVSTSCDVAGKLLPPYNAPAFEPSTGVRFQGLSTN